MSKHREILFGPPGCGKTTQLLRIVEGAIDSGFSPDQICFIAFTRKAANEARERACEKFKLYPEQLPWFRTLHSLAFQQLQLSRQNVMGMRDYFALCEILRISITTKGLSEDGTFTGMTKGDRLFFMENMSRAKMIPLREYWEQCEDDLYWYELERLHNALVAYKKKNDKRDFTDIITLFSEGQGDVPDCRVLIVDEAQDLSPLQWRMVDRIHDKVERTFIAGDDDQAIFRWAGADIEHIINLSGERRVLDQSYRIPESVQHVATAISDRITQRVAKTWKARDAVGQVSYATALEHIDMSIGTWLLLARNGFLLDQYVRHCLQEGFVFESLVGSPLRTEAFKAIRSWETLITGGKVSAAHAKLAYEFLASRDGVAHGFKGKFSDCPDREMVDWQILHDKYGLVTKKPWQEALTKITPEEAEYFEAAIRRGEKIGNEPRIKISTIHGAKGGEAENVVLMTDMAERTWREYQESPDDEHRCWYVAVTRAKERLILLSPQTNRCYDI